MNINIHDNDFPLDMFRSQFGTTTEQDLVDFTDKVWEDRTYVEVLPNYIEKIDRTIDKVNNTLSNMNPEKFDKFIKSGEYKFFLETCESAKEMIDNFYEEKPTEGKKQHLIRLLDIISTFPSYLSVYQEQGPFEYPQDYDREKLNFGRRKLYKGKRGGLYYKRKGKKVYIK